MKQIYVILICSVLLIYHFSFAQDYFELNESQKKPQELISKNPPSNSLPPILQKIHDLEVKMMDIDSAVNPNKVNELSKEIIYLMGKIYTGDTPLKTTLKGFMVTLKFCKEVTISVELSGKIFQKDMHLLEYKIGGGIQKRIWVAEYYVDIINKKGYLHSHAILLPPSTETSSSNCKVHSFSGWIQIDKDREPIISYSVIDGYLNVSIRPTKIKKNVDLFDSKNWPEELVGEYSVDVFPPVIIFKASRFMYPGVYIPEMESITPEEFNNGIRTGNFKKTISNKYSYPGIGNVSQRADINISLKSLVCDDKGTTGAMATSGACIDHGGYILASEDDVYVEGKPVARVGDLVLCLKHGITEIVEDVKVKVYSDKKRIARVGDKTKCGAVIMGGSITVFAGDK